MRERLARFMIGRNGNDQLNRFLLLADVVLLLLASLLGRTALGSLLYLLVLALLGLTYFRMLSRNVYKRRSENEGYLRRKQQLLSRLRVFKERWRQRKDYKFFTCPNCKTALRVPRGHGKVNIVCRKCGTSFTGKT